MPLDVIDGDEGLIQGEGQALGRGNAGQQRPHQTGAIGYGDGVHRPEGQARPVQGFADEGGDGFHMAAGGHLGHDATVFLVQRDLGGGSLAEKLPTVPHDGDGGIVAGGFQGQDHRMAGLRQGPGPQPHALSVPHAGPSFPNRPWPRRAPPARRRRQRAAGLRRT